MVDVLQRGRSLIGMSGLLLVGGRRAGPRGARGRCGLAGEHDGRRRARRRPARAGAPASTARRSSAGSTLVTRATTTTASLVCAGRGAARRALVDAAGRRSASDEDRYATVVHPSVRRPGRLLGRCRQHPARRRRADRRRHASAGTSWRCRTSRSPTTTSSTTSRPSAPASTLGGGVRVGEAAYLGMNASVREDVTRRRRTPCSAWARCCCSDLPAGETWAGVPARPLPTEGPP